MVSIRKLRTVHRRIGHDRAVQDLNIVRASYIYQRVDGGRILDLKAVKNEIRTLKLFQEYMMNQHTIIQKLKDTKVV